MLAGLLLLVPATATLGAVVTFPLVMNIFLITVSVGFRGTPFVTGGMLLAATFLLCWDYHRLKAILWSGAAAGPAIESAGEPAADIGGLERAGYALGTACGLGALAVTRSLLPRDALLPLLAGGLVAALMVAAAWVREAMPVIRRDRAA